MKTLLIGYGSAGKRHSRILKSFRENSIDYVSKQSIQGEKVFPSLVNVPSITDYDYYVICSETSLHYEQLEFINSKTYGKKILVEKPIFDHIYESSPLKNKVFVGYNMRFNKTIQGLKSLLLNEEVLFAEAYVGQFLPQWHPRKDYKKSYSALKSKGGGVALDLSHEIDYLLYLFGKIDIKSYYKSHISDLEIETDDIFTCIGKTEKGIIINCTMDYLCKNLKRTLLVHTNNMTFDCDFIANQIISYSRAGTNAIIRYKEDKDYAYRKMHEDILFDHGGIVADYDQAIDVLRICSNMWES